MPVILDEFIQYWGVFGKTIRDFWLSQRLIDTGPILGWVDVTDSVTTIIPFLQSYDASPDGRVFDTLRAARLPGLPSDAMRGNGYKVWDHRDLDRTDFIAAPTVPNTFTHTADFTLRYTITTLPAAGSIDIYFRKQDASNLWLLRLKFDTVYQLWEFIGGGPVLRGNWTGGANGDVVDLVALNASISVYVNNTLRISYASATNYKTQTNGEVAAISAGGAIANLSTRTLDGLGQAAALPVTDYGSNALHGAPSAVGLVGDNRAGSNEGGQYNGATAYTNIYSAALNAKFNGQEGSFIVRAKCPTSAWTDGAERVLLTFGADGNNYTALRKKAGANSMQWVYVAGGVVLELSQAGFSADTLQTFGQTHSLSADQFKSFVNGSQVGATQNGLGTWAGSLATNLCVIGAGTSVPVNIWNGAISDVIITLNGVVATPTQMSDIHTKLAAGTLTMGDLDTMFGAGNYAWYRHDDRKTVSLPGIATDVLAGPRALGDWFGHEADGLIEWQLDVRPTAGGIVVEFRMQDVINSWQMWANVTGDYALYEYVAGGWTLRGNAVGVLVGGERIIGVFEGTTIKGYYNTTLAWTYASAVNFQTKTLGRIFTLGTDGKLSSLITWPRNLAAAPLTLGASEAKRALDAMAR